MGLILLIAFGTSLWAYFDSKSIGVKKGDLKGLADLGPGGWFWVCLLLWIVGFPMYLAKRGEMKRVSASRPNVTKPGSPVATAASNAPGYLDELEKLAELHKKGVLTDSEFSEKKK